MKEPLKNAPVDGLKESVLYLNEALSKLEKSLYEKNQLIESKDEALFNLEKSLGEKEQEIERLKEQLHLLRHHQFAKKSESANSLQIEIAFEPQEEDPEESEPESEKETITYERKKHKKGRPIDTSSLPREQVLHDLKESEKTCACCQSQLVCIGEDRSEKLEFIPSVLKVVEHIRPKYSCRQCETITAAKKPDDVLPKCLAGSSLLTEVILGKYQNHCPLYRQSKILERAKLDIPANTLCNWVMGVGEALEPLSEALYQQLEITYALQVDETPVKNVQENKKGYMWCYHGLDPGNRFVIFEYQLSRSAAVAEKTLANFNGVLQTDGYMGYAGLRKKSTIQGIGCFAHCRRKFADVVKISHSKKPGKAHEAMSRIGKLYLIEKKARDQNLSALQRYQLRQTEAVPLLKGLKKWLGESVRHVPPKSSLGKAIDYALKQWPYLEAYANHGEIEIDNNLIENQIRPFALGRKNWLFVGNELDLCATYRHNR
jgi:transposase